MKRSCYILLAVSLILSACSIEKEPPLLNTGAGSFEFSGPELKVDHPLLVYTYLPSNYTEDSQVLIVMHGNSRNADDYRDAWIEVAEKNNALLLVPEFSREKGFPESDQYNLGNMFTMDEEENILSSNPESDWSYSLIDPIFDHVVKEMGNNSTDYFIYGHSAGSQFVHRLMIFNPDAKIKKAVCANAGWYTMPDQEQTFPYGMKGTMATQENVKNFFKHEIIILLGVEDNDPEGNNLRRTPEALRQGAHRFERGQYYFNYAQKLADSLNIEFNWHLQAVPGVAHSNSKMAPAAGEVMFD